MLQTETSKTRKEMFDGYKHKHIVNRELEWLIEEGKIRESVYFKGATGDRYTIYIATKRTSNTINYCFLCTISIIYFYVIICNNNNLFI